MTYEQTAAIVMVVMGAYPQMQDKEMGPTVEAWYAVLGHLDEELARLAACEILDTAKFFPAPSEVLAVARSILRERQPKLKELTAREKEITPEARSILRKVRELVADGKAGEYRKKLDITRELAYARSLFPNIAEDLVRKNYTLFNVALRRQSQCCLCGSMDGCPYGGAKMELRMTPAGYVVDTMVQCKNNHRKARRDENDSFRNPDWGKRRA